jgi:hypothetical protein
MEQEQLDALARWVSVGGVARRAVMLALAAALLRGGTYCS